jgi:osmotically-inducible protein OsmY
MSVESPLHAAFRHGGIKALRRRFLELWKGHYQMKLNLRSSGLAFGLGCVLAGFAALGQAQDSTVQQPAPDNTKMNQGDSNPSQPTADKQKDNPSDRDITQQIRDSVVKDKSLSTYAHNVKIISQNGAVTLKGPVRSDDEKQSIEQDAVNVVGKDKVTNELTVKPKR